jgi:hypothetical protein
VLERIAKTDTLEKLEALLLWNVDMERASKKCRRSAEDKWDDLGALTIELEFMTHISNTLCRGKSEWSLYLFHLYIV